MMLLCLFLFSQLDFIRADLLPTSLTTNYLVNPLGLEDTPRFAWKSICVPEPCPRGKYQQSYEIRVYDSQDSLIWDSGVVSSRQSFNIPYAGPTLSGGSVYYWSVQIIDESGNSSSWSELAFFSTGLFNQWSATFIGAANAVSDRSLCPYLRKTFTIPENLFPLKPQSAFAYIGSLGYNEVYINGERVSESVLNPSISYLPVRVMYRVYDITRFLVGGKNVIGIWIGGGWGMSNILNPSGPGPVAIGEVRVGSARVVETNETWKYSPSPYTHNGPWESGNYGGDAVDDRFFIAGWNSIGFDDSNWKQAVEYNLTRILTADIIEPTVKESVVLAKSVTQVSGGWVVEMADVFTGWIEVLNLAGTEGDNVVISVSTHKAVKSEFGMINLYTFNSTGKGAFAQKFSYHEIQFVFINVSSAPQLTDVIGYRLTGNWTRVGNVVTSSALMNQMYEASINNYRGLVLSGYSVDCPHREREGYGGDAHTSFEFALSQYTAGAFFTKWAQDWIDVQEPSGNLPNTAPTVIGGGGPAWGGFIITMPWQIYSTYGDISILQKTYPTMLKLLSFFQSATKSDGLLHPWSDDMWDFLGDWITPHGSESVPTSPENILFNSCYFHYITQLAANISYILGNNSEGQRLQNQADLLSQAIVKNFYISESGLFLDALQTHQAMPLGTLSVLPELKETVLGNLADAISVQKNGHLDTGLTGTYFMTRALIDNYRNDLIFLFANQTSWPGYGWFIERGYTTWPEQWDAFDVPGLSKIHGCYNSIGMWFMQGILGIKQQASGILDGKPDSYAVRVRSGFDCGEINNASGSLETLFGPVVSSWAYLNTHTLVHNITIPVNCPTLFEIPGDSVAHVTESGRPVVGAQGVTFLRQENQYKYLVLIFKLDPGTYNFVSRW